MIVTIVVFTEFYLIYNIHNVQLKIKFSLQLFNLGWFSISFVSLIVWFQKISIPLPRKILWFAPLTPQDFPFQGGLWWPPPPPWNFQWSSVGGVWIFSGITHYSWIRARRQRKLRINPRLKLFKPNLILTCNIILHVWLYSRKATGSLPESWYYILQSLIFLLHF